MEFTGEVGGDEDRFVGREDMNAEVDRLVCAGTSWILLAGTPGTGKTRFASQYCERLETVGISDEANGRTEALNLLAARLYTQTDQRGRRMVPYHLLRYGHYDSAMPTAVMRSIAVQVETIFPQCRSPELEQHALRLSTVLGKASLVLQEDQKRLVVIIDGLDQFEGMNAPNPLARFLPVLPPGVSVICMTRPLYGELGWMKDSGSFASIDFDDSAWAISNQAVCERYAESVKDSVPSSVDTKAAVAASRGNIRYLRELMTQLEDQPRSPLERVPYGYRAYLEQLWDGLNGVPEEECAYMRQGLGILASNSTPMPMVMLAAACGWTDSDATAQFLRAARSVLVDAGSIDGPLYRVFHPAFAELVIAKLTLERASIPRRDAGGGPGPQAGSVPGPATDVRPIVPGPAPAALNAILGPIQNRYALLFGANEFDEPGLSLPYCVNDVTDIGKALQAANYTVVSVVDGQSDPLRLPTVASVRDTLARLKGRLQAEDLLLVHFSCHGIRSTDNQPYLILKDSRIQDPVGTGVSVEYVKSRMWESGSRRLVLFLDACHQGVVLGRGAGGLDADFVKYAYDGAEGINVLAGSTAEEVTQDSNQRRHGILSLGLIEAVSGKADIHHQGFIRFSDIRDYVTQRVRKWSITGVTSVQDPTAWTEGIGDMMVVDNRPSPTAS